MSDVLSKCTVCGALLDEEDLFCGNCGTEAPSRGARNDAARTATHNFRCSSCGASMSYDARAGSLRCPFCGSTQLEAKADARILAPSAVVPFAISQQQAEAAMRTWLGQGFWRPGDLARAASVVGMTAVYVPYWIFSGQTHTYWTADTDRTPAGARGDWFPMTGEHRSRYDGLLIGASGALAPGETMALGQYDLAAAVPPEQVDLENVTVEQFSVHRKFARPLARQGFEQLEAVQCDERYIPGRSRNVKVNTRIDQMHSEPMLLPVWIMAYRYQGRVFRFLVNGQTGKATGQAPVSWRKIAVAVATTLVVLAIILAIAARANGAAPRGQPNASPPVLAPWIAAGNSARSAQRRCEAQFGVPPSRPFA